MKRKMEILALFLLPWLSVVTMGLVVPMSPMSFPALQPLISLAASDGNDVVLYNADGTAEYAAVIEESAVNHNWTVEFNPQAVYAISATIPVTVCLNTTAALHIKLVQFSCDADPATEPHLLLKVADAKIGLANAATLYTVQTAAGVYTSGAVDQAVAAGKFVYLTYVDDPDDTILTGTLQVTWTYD